MTRRTVPATVVQTERDFQRAVIQYARTNGWRCGHIADSRKQVRNGGRLILVGDRDATGLPDWVLVRERVVWAELKGPRTRVTEQQLAWMAALTDAGEEVYLWRAGATDVWPSIELALGNGRAPQPTERST